MCLIHVYIYIYKTLIALSPGCGQFHDWVGCMLLTTPTAYVLLRLPSLMLLRIYIGCGQMGSALVGPPGVNRGQY